MRKAIFVLTMDIKGYIQNIVNECVKDVVNENTKRSKIRKIVKEELDHIFEAEDEKRSYVMKCLDNPLFNHAQLAYKLYKPKNKKEKDTVRSLFSKKANGNPDDNGVVRKFSDEEINKVYSIVRKQ